MKKIFVDKFAEINKRCSACNFKCDLPDVCCREVSALLETEGVEDFSPVYRIPYELPKHKQWVLVYIKDVGWRCAEYDERFAKFFTGVRVVALRDAVAWKDLPPDL